MTRYQTDEITYPRIFLRELADEDNIYEQTKKPFMVAGTAVRIYKSNDIICSFMLEDFTRGQVVEAFSDKLPIDFVLELGDILEVKGNLVMNKFNERVIRVFKIRRITMNEEMIHYLEILHSKKQKSPQGFNEESVLVNEGEIVGQSQNKLLPSDEILRKKMFSAIFSFAMKNVEKLKNSEGFIERTELLELPDINAIREKIKNDASFEKNFEEALISLETSELIAFVNKDLVFNLDFFENFDNLFIMKVDEIVDPEYSLKQLYYKFNEVIENNRTNLITRELVYKYVNKLIFRKKLTTVENKKETYRKIQAYQFVDIRVMKGPRVRFSVAFFCFEPILWQSRSRSWYVFMNWMIPILQIAVFRMFNWERILVFVSDSSLICNRFDRR